MEVAAASLRVDPRSLEVLDWNAVKAALVERVSTSLGESAVATLVPGRLTADRARRQALGILELAQLFGEMDRGLPVSDIPDVGDTLRRIERGGEITVPDFADLLRAHKGTQGLHHFVQRYAAAKPALKESLAGFDLLEDWSRAHIPLVDLKGEIADSASNDLKALRKLAGDLHKRIQERLKDYLNNPKLAEVMQEFYVTVRDGRYVLPVKTSFRARVPGIIHDVSSTEATLFIEPQEIVDANNQLKVVEQEIAAEIARILAEVVKATAPHAAAFRRNQKLVGLADQLDAAAELARDWGGTATAVEWIDGPVAEFEKLRHPTLVLKRKVVPNSLSWREGLVLSGPNTGGKTVLLKSVGLAVALSYAGLPVPAESVKIPSKLKGLFVDIGDDQSLEQNLSTFSAHLAVLKNILKDAVEGDLVLVDEIATGTSPEEGEPLAQAVLETFLSRGVRFFVTTHYRSLKSFAMSDERVRIGAMAFDRLTRSATYELLLDVPGESSALETAEQLGLPKDVVARARELRGEVSEDLTKAIQKLETARNAFTDRERQLVEAKSKLEDDSRRLKDKIAEYEARQREGLSVEARDLLKGFNELREELAKSVRTASTNDLGAGATGLFTKLSDASETVRQVIDDAKKGENVAPLAGDEDIVVDAVLEIDGLGLGTVVEVPRDLAGNARAIVLVQVGDLKTRVVRNRLRRPAKDRVNSFATHRAANAAARERNEQKTSLGPTRAAAASSSGTGGSVICDVRGRSKEEAMRRLDAALNEISRNENSVVTCIHGHGTDRLKDAIRDYLAKDRGDLVYRSGSWPGEGGDGVTIIERRF